MTEHDPAFQPRVWFVTGASSGFGRAISNAMATDFPHPPAQAHA